MKAISIPKKVNYSVVRLVAGQVFLLSLVYIVTKQPVVAGVLLMDFAARALGYPQFSLLALTGRVLAETVNLRVRPIFFRPKRFAAAIGFFLSLLIVVFSIMGNVYLSFGLSGLLMIFSFLESALGFCAGCKIYAFLIQKGWISSDNCPDCAG